MGLVDWCPPPGVGGGRGAPACPCRLILSDVMAEREAQVAYKQHMATLRKEQEHDFLATRNKARRGGAVPLLATCVLWTRGRSAPVASGSRRGGACLLQALEVAEAQELQKLREEKERLLDQQRVQLEQLEELKQK